MDGSFALQALARNAEQEDLYYADKANTKVQSINVMYNTRFRSDFSNKTAGVSVFSIPPVAGVRHVVAVIGYDAASALSGQAGKFALSRGWGYNAIAQISFRIGSSSQFFLSGDQLLARNLRLCRTQSQRDSILSLGGEQAVSAADFATDKYAYIPLTCFTSPSADGISLPVPTDLLSSQIQITVQLKPSAQFWIANTAGGALPGPAAPPSTFDTAFFQCEQLDFENRADALANRADMDVNAYAMPSVDFDQQIVKIPIAATAGPLGPGVQTAVALTGIRSGELKKIQLWLTKDGDTLNPAFWYTPKSVTALYGGQIYAQYEAGSSRIWNLLDGTAPAAVNQSQLALPAVPGVLTATGKLSEWCELPFSQPTGRDYSADVLVHGMEVKTGLVNLQITPPTNEAYTLNVVYVFGSTLSFSRGSCDVLM